MNISKNHSTMSENTLSMQRWNVIEALHNPKGILWYANFPKGQVKVVFSWSFGVMGFGCILNIHPRYNSTRIQQVFLTY